jgi:hypothetical protein
MEEISEEEWETLLKRYIQVNYCLFCKNNTHETHWLYNGCKQCIKYYMTVVQEVVKAKEGK